MQLKGCSGQQIVVRRGIATKDSIVVELTLPITYMIQYDRESSIQYEDCLGTLF